MQESSGKAAAEHGSEGGAPVPDACVMVTMQGWDFPAAPDVFIILFGGGRFSILFINRLAVTVGLMASIS
jgi:hypothetical protein